MKRFLVDTLASIAFFVPISLVLNILLAGLSLEDAVRVSKVSILISVSFGGPFGIFLNRIRRIFHV